MSWFFQSKIAKSHFYVWYLGSKEADGVRGSAVVLPVMRQLLKESFKKTPSKATVQVSSSVPIYYNVIPEQLEKNCTTKKLFTGKKTFHIFSFIQKISTKKNKERRFFSLVQTFKDLSMTWSIDYSYLDYWFQGTVKALYEVHPDLFLFLSRNNNNNGSECSGSINQNPLRPQRSCSQSRSVSRSTAGFDERSSPLERDQRNRTSDIDAPPRRQAPTISRRVVDELKNRIIGESRLMNLGRSRESSLNRYESEKRASLSDLPIETDSTRYRMFGDTMLRDTKNKSRSLDDLAADPLVSTFVLISRLLEQHIITVTFEAASLHLLHLVDSRDQNMLLTLLGTIRTNGPTH
ncbi:Protein CBG18044 [Caenorhabditis briggsae]|uniref:Protein CBG18044 n=1 Tax=Caenorhabditis briggsae TaxID=6238 RepID=A8XSW8_CAEBR|nr:Protein CBG18044 [Caenorhabditis briggsae]CAP35571.2 Protein CBG18044 [Caenorhabditis briggsae]